MRAESEMGASLESYRPALVKTAVLLTRDWSRAEDLVQRTFVRALRATSVPREPRATLGWLRTIMKNLCIDAGRHHNVEQRVLGALSAGKPIAAEPSHARQVELKVQLNEALRGIPSEMAQAILLVVVEGCTYAEVAELQSVAVGTVKSRVSRARRALARALSTPRDDHENAR